MNCENISSYSMTNFAPLDDLTTTHFGWEFSSIKKLAASVLRNMDEDAIITNKVVISFIFDGLNVSTAFVLSLLLACLAAGSSYPQILTSTSFFNPHMNRVRTSTKVELLRHRKVFSIHFLVLLDGDALFSLGHWFFSIFFDFDWSSIITTWQTNKLAWLSYYVGCSF